MILPILYTLKGKLLLGVTTLLAGIVITEVFLGQVVASFIAALPLCAGVYFVWRAQQQAMVERAEMSHRLDGKLDALMEARVAVGKAEGKAEERTESRARQGEAAIALQPETPAQVEIAQPDDKPVPVKPNVKL